MRGLTRCVDGVRFVFRELVESTSCACADGPRQIGWEFTSLHRQSPQFCFLNRTPRCKCVHLSSFSPPQTLRLTVKSNAVSVHLLPRPNSAFSPAPCYSLIFVKSAASHSVKTSQRASREWHKKTKISLLPSSLGRLVNRAEKMVFNSDKWLYRPSLPSLRRSLNEGVSESRVFLKRASGEEEKEITPPSLSIPFFCCDLSPPGPH